MKPLGRAVLGTVIVGGGVLGGGNSNDPWLWAYVAVFASMAFYALQGMEPDLVRERFTPPSPGADRLSLRFVRIVALAHVVVAVLDSRYGWSHVPGVLRAVGIAGFAACFLVIVRASRTNPFFSAVVRIQSERGHQVVDTGPYAMIRHPGYAGMLPMVQFSGLALGSWYAFAVAFWYSALILRRVRFEDTFLRTNLDGYVGYAARVPYRLIPRVW
jgi:protein-S-isoprenylcysteine O-methyltransferase Ste14